MMDPTLRELNMAVDNANGMFAYSIFIFILAVIVIYQLDK